MDKVTKSKFLLFENDKNNCWLNASLVLVAHNKTLRKITDGAPDSIINKIIAVYDAAMCHLNDSDINIELRKKRAKTMLQRIQTDTHSYLQQFLKSAVGEPDSAFCALLNLIKRDRSNVEKYLNANWFWKKLCTNCDKSSTSGSIVKPIITLSKVKNFQPIIPTSCYMCECKTEQEMQLIYKELPACLIFHFENGAGNKGSFPLTFTIKEREYLLAVVVILKKCKDPSLNHFVTWVRNPSANLWLNCNDLNTDIVSFSFEKPECNLKDVYMYVFESFDTLNKIESEVPTAQNKENVSVEVIDLSDETDEIKHLLENKSCENDTSKLHQGVKDKEISATSVIKKAEYNTNMHPLNKRDSMTKDKNKSDLTPMQKLRYAEYKKCLGITKLPLYGRPSIIERRNKLPMTGLRFSFMKSLEAIRLAYSSKAFLESCNSNNAVKASEVQIPVKITPDNPLGKEIHIKNDEIHEIGKKRKSNGNSPDNVNSDTERDQSLHDFSLLPKNIFKKRKHSHQQSSTHSVDHESEKLSTNFRNINISDSSYLHKVAQPNDNKISGGSQLDEKEQHSFADQNKKKTVSFSFHHSPAKAEVIDITQQSEMSDEKKLLL